MKTPEHEKSRSGDIALTAQATVAALVLFLSASLCAFGGLLATGLVHLG